MVVSRLTVSRAAPCLIKHSTATDKEKKTTISAETIMLRGLIFLAVSGTAFGQEPPPYLRDAVIEVKLRNGDLYSFPGKDWTVVRRDNNRVVAPVCPSCKPCTIKDCVSDPKEVEALKAKVDSQQKEIARLTQMLAEASNRNSVPPPAPVMVDPVLPSSAPMLNRVTVMAGLGSQSVVVQDELGSFLETSLVPVFGAEYSRIVFDNYSASLGVISNQTFTIGAGYNW